jgi:hypothetical protein
LQSLRGVTLPNEDVMNLLSSRFHLVWRNIEKESHVGLSHGYKPNQTAVGTTNGAGGRNVQLVVLAADETVVHVMPGFWHAEDLLGELRLALDVHRLYRDEELTTEGKQAMFAALHRSFLRRMSPETIGRSGWQGFDVWVEAERAKRQPGRDTVVCDETGQTVAGQGGVPQLKPVSQVVHERMAARPFRKLADFDMESFVDYGRAFYDNNQGLDKGKSFPRAEQANQKREKEQAKSEKAAAADARKDARR